MGEKQMTWAEIAASNGQNRRDDSKGTSVDEVMNKEIEIQKVEMTTNLDGQPLLRIHLTDGRVVRSGGTTLLKQAADMKSVLEAGKTIKTTITKQRTKDGKRTYYKFV